MKDVREHIIYEDNDICVCHKPSGVLTQADRGFSQDMVSALLTYERRKGNKNPFIAPVNRLDRPVEGLVLYAKNSRVAAALTKQLTNGGVDKWYYAVVDVNADMEEELADSVGTQITLEDYLVKDARTNMSRVASADTDGAKKAVLEYEVLSVHGGRALLRVKLHTGRHHQIRVQLSNAGLPIVGDTKYNVNLKDASVPGGRGSDALALCSYRLAFSHPATGKKLNYEILPKGTAFAEFKENNE